MAALRVPPGGSPGQVFALSGESTSLGRHPSCDIVLESLAVSRQHARIVRSQGQYYLEDLHSRNGTLVNGQPVLQRRRLAAGDRVTICDVQLIFQGDPPSLRVPAADERSESATQAMLVDDERPPGRSTIVSKVDVSTGSSSLQLQVNPQAKLKALIEIGQSLGQALGLGEVLPRLIEGLFKIFVQADRGFIVLKDPQTGRLVPKAVRHRRADAGETIRISRTIVNSVMATKEAILSADATADSRFEMAESIVDFQIRSMMCAPLVNSEGKAMGVIQIDTLDPRNRFNLEDLDMLASVACQAAFAVENAQLHEAALRQQALARDLALAHEVQRSLLPSASPRLEQYDFFEFYEPANELGGDYYDYVPLPGGRWAVLVADVSGKGISAALLMARLSAETRFCLASEPTPAAALGRLNQVFCSSGWDDRFVTLVLAVLDPLRHEVTIANAGHLPPLLRRASAAVDPVAVDPVAEEETRLPLGIDRDTTYPQCVLPLAPGESLTLYTDGITDAMSPAEEPYGPQRLLAQLSSEADRVGTLGRRVLDDVKRFIGDRRQADDMCLACFGRSG